ncbi:hypothetical protein NLJ89_g4355 [Agrocybe chaxingu]|uniref:(2E,6E)-farnesyl diphosphate synthase n=1 Tax=Agrocybe chaxingu TaxID=84603 RepID=A0A9W8MW15_9AGAR|nr:hypothetical protein NLJ89_g4355 [Agrocybe chaxingu]
MVCDYAGRLLSALGFALHPTRSDAATEKMPSIDVARNESPIYIPDGDVWSQNDEDSIIEPYRYIAALPGKDMRGRFIDALNLWMHVPTEPLKIIKEIVSKLHVASLMIDDIEDNSDLRRGQPSAHKVFGVPQTINSANYIYFLTMEDAFKLEPYSLKGRSAVRAVVAELLSLHRGQGLDIVWRDNRKCPTESQYVDMVNKKTSGLLRVAAKLMATCATQNTSVDFVPLVDAFGVFFQIRDDLMNLDSQEYEETKGFAEDLTEGKFSFPIIHGINEKPDSTLLIDVLNEHPTTAPPKLEAIDYMRYQTRSFEYTETVLSTLETYIRDEIERFGGNPPLVGLVDKLSKRGNN